MILPRNDLCLKALGCALAFTGAVGGAAFAQTFETVRFSYSLGREALPALAAIEVGFFFFFCTMSDLDLHGRQI